MKTKYPKMHNKKRSSGMNIKYIQKYFLKCLWTHNPKIIFYYNLIVLLVLLYSTVQKLQAPHMFLGFQQSHKDHTYIQILCKYAWCQLICMKKNVNSDGLCLGLRAEDKTCRSAVKRNFIFAIDFLSYCGVLHSHNNN